MGAGWEYNHHITSLHKLHWLYHNKTRLDPLLALEEVSFSVIYKLNFMGSTDGVKVPLDDVTYHSD